MISSEPGCYYSGDAITATLYKNQEHTVESYEKTNDWDKYDRTEVSGRAAARAISAGNVDARLCSTILNAGSGVIIAQVHESDPGNIDECAKALEIAEKVEPNVPEPA